MNRPLVRVAPWLILACMAYVLGRWQGRSSAVTAAEDRASGSLESVPPAAVPAPAAATAQPSRTETLAARLDELHAAARTMANPDARTYAYFEELELADLPAVVSQIRGMPVGNEQDLFFAMAIRRWAALDVPAALEAASKFPALGVRQTAELGAWETWGSRDPRAAMARATAAEPGASRDRNLAALLGGAAMLDPRLALELWQSSPEDFRNAALGPPSLDEIVAAACGTGKREAVKTLVGELPAGATRDRLAAALCAEWGGHYPDEALLWLNELMPEGDARVAGMARIFESLVDKDPALAATWGAGFPDARRRSGMIASAVSSWAEIDPVEAELWINEQADSPELDGATFAMAAHFIGAKNMPKAFAWIRRIRRDEARSELLGNLGRAWSKNRPAEFRQFLDQTSLNQAELDSLLSKIDPPS